MRSHERAQAFGHGESDEEVVTGKSGFKPFFEPFSAFDVLTLRTMAIPAGTEGPVELSALTTLIARDSACFGPAIDDRPDDFSVLVRNSVAVAFHVFGTEGPEDLIYLSHGPALPSPD
jgi:hypothetical protein